MKIFLIVSSDVCKVILACLAAWLVCWEYMHLAMWLDLAGPDPYGKTLLPDLLALTMLLGISFCVLYALGHIVFAIYILIGEYISCLKDRDL